MNESKEADSKFGTIFVNSWLELAVRGPNRDSTKLQAISDPRKDTSTIAGIDSPLLRTSLPSKFNELPWRWPRAQAKVAHPTLHFTDHLPFQTALTHQGSYWQRAWWSGDWLNPLISWVVCPIGTDIWCYATILISKLALEWISFNNNVKGMGLKKKSTSCTLQVLTGCVVRNIR